MPFCHTFPLPLPFSLGPRVSMSPLRASPDSARRLRSQRQLHALVLTVTRHSTHGQMEGKAHRTDAPAGPAGRRLPSEPRGRHLKSRSPSCRTVRCAGGGRATKALRPAPLRCVVMQTGSGGPRGGGTAGGILHTCGHFPPPGT